VLAPGKRTVTQALRVMGLSDDPGFGRYHEVLNRARWDTRALARRLLLHVLERLLPTGPVVIGVDDTIERRWGARINARGILSGSVRSSKGHFAQDQRPALAVADGHRTDPLGRTGVWGEAGKGSAGASPVGMPDEGLPFLTILAPSARWSEANGKPHKTPDNLGAAGQFCQTKRWLPDRRLIFVGDSGFAALDLLAAFRCHVCVITRLRLDANSLQTRSCAKTRSKRGRNPLLKGRALPKLSVVLNNPKTIWTTLVVSQWYGDQQRTLQTTTGTAVLVPQWHSASAHPLGAGPRPARGTRPSGVPQHRSRCPPARDDTSVVCFPLARWMGNDFPRGPCPSRLRRNHSVSGPTSPFCEPPPVLLGLFSLITIWANELAQAPGGLLRSHATAWVPKEGSDLQRRHRRRQARTVVTTGFLHVPGQ